jgi:hypothetical protein
VDVIAVAGRIHHVLVIDHRHPEARWP